jgi:hypothetical protein
MSEGQDRELSQEELDDLQRRRIDEWASRETPAAPSSQRGFARLRAMLEAEWRAPEEADAKPQAKPKKPSKSARTKTQTRKPEEVETICPRCGNDNVKRYPYRQDAWLYACLDCNRTFRPEVEG